MPDYPQVTYEVKTYDINKLLQYPQPDGNIENIVNSLKNQTVYCPFVSQPLKHGDVFSLFGKEAILARNQINQTLSSTFSELYYGPPTTPPPPILVIFGYWE